MLTCPECQFDLDASQIGDANSLRCPVCGRPVYVVHDPIGTSGMFPALSNSDSLRVPTDILTHKIIDQSPMNEPPRNMIIEFDDGRACLLVQAESSSGSARRVTRKSIEKPAFALKRDVLLVRLPVELVAKVRSQNNQNIG